MNKSCPNCGESIPAPGGWHGGPLSASTAHSHAVCPNCARSLIWYTEGELATGWRIDEDAERRRKLGADD
jgi:predicted RNA-binding Zn-ribbon protein involved in translation (DUF1610 family)